MTENNKQSVSKVNPFDQTGLGSLGKEGLMFVRQWNFPNKHLKSEKVCGRWHDRLEYSHMKNCFGRHIGITTDSINSAGIVNWFRNTQKETIMEFIVELLQPKIKPTGFRVIATIGANGHIFWLFQLFFKSSDSNTRVYSNDNAPNILQKRPNQ